MAGCQGQRRVEETIVVNADRSAQVDAISLFSTQDLTSIVIESEKECQKFQRAVQVS